jgi:type VI protein secretion system component VasF
MDDLEDRLRRAFEREDPPEGFADRVIERTRARRAMPRWIAAAAAVLVLAGAGYGYRWQQGLKAKREVLLAFRLTSAKLNHIHMQVAR